MRRLFAFLAAAWFAAGALPAQADCLALGADERLSAACLLEQFVNAGPQLQEATRPFVLRILARQGLPRVPDQRFSKQFYVQPLLAYSRDINGGNPDRELDLGWIVLLPDTDQVQKAGLLVGARAGVQGRYIYRPGGYFDFNVYGSGEYSPRHDIGLTTAFGQLCSYNAVDLTWTLDLCGSVVEVNRDLSLDHAETVDITAGRQFRFGPNMHQRVFAGLRSVSTLDYNQLQTFFGFEAMSARYPFFSVAATFAEPVDDQTVLLQSVTGTVSDQLMGRPFALTLAHRYSGGSTIFGRERLERTLLANFSYNIWRSYYLSIGYRDVDSTIDYFDESEPIFGISIATIRF
jgi:hypothetical protein